MIRKLGAIVMVLALTLSAGLASVAPVGASNPLPDLVGLWHFDDDADDSSGNGNHGALMGDAGFADGIFGQALSLDGVGQYVCVPDGPSMGIGQVTVEMWVYPMMKPTDSTAKHLIDKRTAGDWEDEYTALLRGNGELVVRVNADTDRPLFQSGAGTVPMDQWSHIAFTWDGSILRVYLNKTEIGTALGSGDIVNNEQNLTIGARVDLGSAHFFYGLIDEVRIWNEALTAEQIGKYPLTVDDNIYDLSGVSAQSGWYDEWTDVHLEAPLTVIGDCTLYVFEEWLVDTASNGIGDNEIVVNMRGPKQATASYTELDATETAWAAEETGLHRFVDQGNWATYINYGVGEDIDGDPVSYPLFAGQHHDAGQVLVWNDADTLYVQYMPKVGYEYVEGIYGEWLVEGTHLHVAGDLGGFDDVRTYHRRSGEYRNPIPGQFDHKSKDGYYELSLGDLGLAGAEELVIAAHADVKWCPIAYAPTADGMVLWLDASALALLDGSSVAEWDDLSGNYNHAGQTDEARQPTYVVSGLDGMPVVQFDGSNHMDVGKSLHGLGIEREAAIFVVVSSTLSTEVTVHDVLSDWASTAGGATVRIRPNGGLEVYVYPNDHRATSATGIVAADEFFVFTSHWFADSHVLYKNGVSVASTALTDDVGDAETLKIGARGDLLDRSFLHGDIAEILIYDRALTSEEREEVEQYLSSKWGL